MSLQILILFLSQTKNQIHFMSYDEQIERTTTPRIWRMDSPFQMKSGIILDIQ